MTCVRAATAAELLSSGGRIGQVVVLKSPEGFEIRHREDERRGADDLEVFDIEDAIELAKYHDSGTYRPLKTAPNLRHGWRIQCVTEADVRRVIDQIYPGRLAVVLQWQHGLTTVPLRDTLNRQSGMYKVTASISDEQIDDLVAGFCRSDGGCLRTIFWRRDEKGAIPSSKLPAAKFDAAHDQTGRGQPCVPLVCQEACNLLVGAARQVVKDSRAMADI